MMIEELRKSENIGIVIKDDKDKDIALVNLAFILLCLKLNKKIHYRFNNNLPLLPVCEPCPQIVLTVQKQIADIFYEKSNEGIKLFLTPKENNLSKEDFCCELKNKEEKTNLDLIVSIGFKSLKELEKNIENESVSIENTQIINIDNSHLNKIFGNINLIENGVPLSKIFLKNIEEEFLDENISSLFSSEGKVESLLNVFSKIEIEKNVFLAEIDNLKENEIPFILSTLKDCLFIQNFILIFNKKNCVFYLENKEILNKVKETFNAQIKNNGGIFSKENLSKEDLINILK